MSTLESLLCSLQKRLCCKAVQKGGKDDGEWMEPTRRPINVVTDLASLSTDASSETNEGHQVNTSRRVSWAHDKRSETKKGDAEKKTRATVTGAVVSKNFLKASDISFYASFYDSDPEEDDESEDDDDEVDESEDDDDEVLRLCGA